MEIYIKPNKGGWAPASDFLIYFLGSTINKRRRVLYNLLQTASFQCFRTPHLLLLLLFSIFFKHLSFLRPLFSSSCFKPANKDVGGRKCWQSGCSPPPALASTLLHGYCNSLASEFWNTFRRTIDLPPLISLLRCPYGILQSPILMCSWSNICSIFVALEF